MIIDFVDKMNALIKTSYRFPNQTAVYNGKVRDVYTIGGKELVMITTDRIDASRNTFQRADIEPNSS